MGTLWENAAFHIQHKATQMFLGVDTGGTFTDFVLLEKGTCRIHKVLSTPEDPARAILQGIDDLHLETAIRTGQLQVVHGSTVATNAALEGKGVETVYVGNRGFTDLLHIARQTRDEIYALRPQRKPLPLKREACLGTGGRIDAQGRIIEPLTDLDIQQLRTRIQALRPRAIAINLLYSYIDERWEKQLQEALEDLAFTTRSSYVLPEYGEYERGMATFLNAWLGPVVQQYLERLSTALAPARVSVMQSSGGTISAEQASIRAVNLLVSGPAGGLAAATYLGAHHDCPNIMTFDMGGTSTDVSLIQGAPVLTSEGRVGPYPVAIPMADIHTIGAGGGSLASLDDGGNLQVGPESAGAHPGPAAYGLGGTLATVTDANVALGRLPADTRLGGTLRLDREAALRSLTPLARGLGVDPLVAARGILEIANAHMSRALKVISLERGFDPTQFTLLCYGGAGGLHVCAVADQLDIRQIIIPADAGVFSAFGMLVANPSRDVVRTWNQLLQDVSVLAIEAAFQESAREPAAELLAESIESRPDELTVSQSVDLRYRGQSFYLTLGWQNSLEQLERNFHAAHANRFGHAFDLPVELVNLRLHLVLPRTPPSLSNRSPASAEDVIAGQSEPGVCLVEELGEVPLYERRLLNYKEKIAGPAVLRDPVSTTFIDQTWNFELGESGHLWVSRKA